MKVGNEVICIDNIPNINTNGEAITIRDKPIKNNIYTVDGSNKRSNGTIGIYLVGFNEIGSTGRINFNIKYFSELPPSLEAEIKECLERELVEI